MSINMAEKEKSERCFNDITIKNIQDHAFNLRSLVNEFTDVINTDLSFGNNRLEELLKTCNKYKELIEAEEMSIITIAQSMMHSKIESEDNQHG